MSEFSNLLSKDNPTDSSMQILMINWNSLLWTLAFPVQLVTLASSLKSEIAKVSSVKDLAHLLIVDHAAMTSALTDVVSALLLFLTLPVTIASAERSFSKLPIKSYLRSTMGQDRLCALALLSIEAESAQFMKTDKLIECLHLQRLAGKLSAEEKWVESWGCVTACVSHVNFGSLLDNLKVGTVYVWTCQLTLETHTLILSHYHNSRVTLHNCL